MAIYPDRKGNKLTGRFRVEVQSAGRRLRGRADSLKEAKLLEAELTAQLTGVEPPAPKATPKPVAPLSAPVALPCLTLGEAADKALPVLWSGQATEGGTKRKLERIVALLGRDLPMDDLDTNVADKLVQWLRDRDTADGTINRYLSCLSAFLRFSKRRGYRTCDLPELEWRAETETRIRWITLEEEARLMKVLPPPFDSVVHIAIRTGMRANELLMLKPEQVSPAWVHLWKTKNGSERYVPLAPGLYELLAPLVSKGEMPTYRRLAMRWETARKKIGLAKDPTFVFHACRHTYATRAVQAEVNIRVLQRLMGHKTIQTTLRYAHVEDRTLADAVAKMHAFHDARRGTKVGEKAYIPPPSRTEGSVWNRYFTGTYVKRSASVLFCKSSHAGSIPARASTAGISLHILAYAGFAVFRASPAGAQPGACPVGAALRAGRSPAELSRPSPIASARIAMGPNQRHCHQRLRLRSRGSRGGSGFQPWNWPRFFGGRLNLCTVPMPGLSRHPGP